MTWQIALAVAAALFCAFTIWRVRPSLGPRKVDQAKQKAFKEARARVLQATTPADRLLALCDAGDARVELRGSAAGALGYYVRAMRIDPASTEPVTRATRALGRHPRVLESFLWRRLASTPWQGANRSSALAALTGLQRVYAGSRRDRARATAIRHALDALNATAQPEAAAPDASPRAASTDRG